MHTHSNRDRKGINQRSGCAVAGEDGEGGGDKEAEGGEWARSTQSTKTTCPTT